MDPLVIDGLHLARFGGRGDPVFLLHGAVENARIFHSSSGKGLAPYLAAQGYDVFAGDLRGRGLSVPRVSRASRHGQTDSIVSEIPAMLRAIAEATDGRPQIWGAHSWGGVLLLSVLARFPEWRPRVRAVILFGTKRRVRVSNPEVWLKIDLLWNRIGLVVARAAGYLPARRLGAGSDDETRLSHAQGVAWIRPDSPWVDPGDGFDYGTASREAGARGELPPILSLTGSADRCLGHPLDAKGFLEETGAPRSELHVLGRASACRHDYGHIDLLTHPDAPGDHFPGIVRWLGGGSFRRP